MNIFEMLVPKMPMCIICGGRFRAEHIHISKDKLCICKDCWERVDKFTSPAAFKRERNLKSHIAAFPYEGELREAFKRYKFHGEYAYGDIFSLLMCDCLEKFFAKGDFDLVAPIPLSKERMNERGYNQSAVLAKSTAERFEIEYSENALFRIRHTKRQSGLNSKERVGNVRGAFLASKDAVCGRNILLVDDIYTMGVTMRECADALSNANAKSVVGFTLFGVTEKQYCQLEH